MISLHATRAAAAEALRLRRWALHRLLHDVTVAPPDASTDAWRLFLRWERCAVLVQESLATTSDELPPHAAAELRAAALRELRRILSARAQLHLIADIARGAGLHVIVLKGTADVARGLNVPVMDVDVLASPAQARSLANELDGRGFVPAQQGGIWHLQARTSTDALFIEVHQAVIGFDSPPAVPWMDTRPLDGMAPLLELAPHDHAWTVLCQAVHKHPERRERIRDLVMLRVALGRCEPAEVVQLVRRAREDPCRSAFGTMLERVERNAAMEPGAALRRLQRVYLMQARRRPVAAGSVLATLWRLAFHGAAIGPVANWRRVNRLRTAAATRRWHPRSLLHTPALAVAAAGAMLLTLDAPLMPSDGSP